MKRLGIWDVYKFYIEQPFCFKFKNGQVIYGFIEVYTTNFFMCGNAVDLENGFISWYEIDNFLTDGEFKFILHPPSYEKVKFTTVFNSLCKRLPSRKSGEVYKVDTPLSLHYAISNGYDMFDLIENGHAICYDNISDLMKRRLKTIKKMK